MEARDDEHARPTDFSPSAIPGRVARRHLPEEESTVQEDGHERPETEPDNAEAERRLSTLAEISREMVRIYKVQFGRGPTKARTAFAGPDLIVCTLEDTLTPVERKMAAVGDHERLRDLRLYFQYMAESQFCEVIERALGRKVRAFISGMDTRKDVAAEIFYLESEEESEEG
jgi:uncharacterized protein YbcI